MRHLKLSSVVISLGWLLGILLIASPSLAQPISDVQLGLPYGAATGLPASDVRLTIARIIQVAISLLGIIALAIVVYAGFTWMTAGGNEEKITEAKKWLFAGVIGMAIILSAYSITAFVVRGLVTATGG